jgi:hypothetical protein
MKVKIRIDTIILFIVFSFCISYLFKRIDDLKVQLKFTEEQHNVASNEASSWREEFYRCRELVGWEKDYELLKLEDQLSKYKQGRG